MDFNIAQNAGPFRIIENEQQAKPSPGLDRSTGPGAGNAPGDRRNRRVSKTAAGFHPQKAGARRRATAAPTRSNPGRTSGRPGSPGPSKRSARSGRADQAVASSQIERSRIPRIIIERGDVGMIEARMRPPARGSAEKQPARQEFRAHDVVLRTEHACVEAKLRASRGRQRQREDDGPHWLKSTAEARMGRVAASARENPQNSRKTP